MQQRVDHGSGFTLWVIGIDVVVVTLGLRMDVSAQAQPGGPIDGPGRKTDERIICVIPEQRRPACRAKAATGFGR